MATPACTFVIFGITGDLAARKLMPAVFELHKQGSLHPDTRLVGYSRRDWDDAKLRDEVKKALKKFAPKAFDEAAWEGLAPRFSFVSGGYDDAAGFSRLAEHLDSLGHPNRIFYTSTPPSTYGGIALHLANAGLNRSGGWTRLVIEKPFGNDLESARELNKIVLEHFDESQVYRIDHYLAKETAQNIAALRFANTIFEPTWNSQYVDHVQVTMAEPMGMEGRGGFYDETGVVRDVIQNHLLQLVALTATEPPSRYDARSVRDEKVKVFQAMTCADPAASVIGQYRGYRDEPDIPDGSRQGTYAALELTISNWRWAGVPFFIRSGKGLRSKSSEIVVVYKRPPHIPFELRGPVKPDRMILRLQPNEGISLRFLAKKPGQGVSLSRASMDFYYDEEFNKGGRDAYETLLEDAMMGDATLFMRADEVEAQWRIVEPVISTWENAADDPAFYERGSWGPDEADDLMIKSGRSWHVPQVD
ncbi:MAG: Glucose-6-phosphate 1-dehydrogenase [uncultured Truepera sp.]|uniref:Glucose-6-phosphate 1-dehydrogenase n=1 Tax=uncultured Truepera sp. TaxID=543023 RepID=A0A6J4VTP6_9DEIN|nr:MAG: Glucose-6-phosphate 1-dehydrogenase [uncultured Truepera sp.]